MQIILKKQAARLLRDKINIPARKISKTYKKIKIVDELRHYNILVKIKQYE